MFKRRKTKNFFIGTRGCGHLSPVSIQSMTNTPTENVKETLAQIKALAEAGCEIVRVAVPDQKAGEALATIVPASPVPLIADIHFDYRLALLALKNGVHGLRLNPGNIGAQWKIKEIAEMAQAQNIPLRVGVNSGSLQKNLLTKYGRPTARAMVESALEQVELLEKFNFTLLKISLKASHVPLMLEAYREMAQLVSYPFHLGVTEAGLLTSGTIKSAVGIGTLLAEGIGDTIRVSLTADPLQEIEVAQQILRSLGLFKKGIEIIACPTCARSQINVIALAQEVAEKLKGVNEPLQIAIMGCAVNGPGEAREADLGIAGGQGEGLLFVKGQVQKKVAAENLVEVLCQEVAKLIQKNK